MSAANEAKLRNKEIATQVWRETKESFQKIAWFDQAISNEDFEAIINKFNSVN
jgi:hypothetical protein